MELGKDKIRFNSILPGWTMTERCPAPMEFRAENNKTTVEEEIARQIVRDPAGTHGTTRGVRLEFAVFLVLPAASYVDGVMLNVDGGIVKGLF